MVVNIHIMSQQIIKPSSPTPHHLSSLKLSFLDQIAPPVYVPIILFYQTDPDIDCGQLSKGLKQSLSDALTRFYFLAGRIKNNFFINCNDEGVEYVEAQVHAQLSDVIEKPNMETIKRLLPIEPYSGGRDRDIILAIQVNFFECGGMAVGVCISHVIADGASLVNFINAWAATSHGYSTDFMQSSYDVARYFPPRDLSGFAPTAGITTEKLVTKRFVFDSMKLKALKEAASSACVSQVKDPTRVEALSAFFWRHFMNISKAKTDNKPKMFAAVHAVNLRSRMNPPLPYHAFGNLWRFATALSMPDDEKGCDHVLVSKLRNAIRQIDSDYVKKLQDGGWYLDYLKRSKDMFCGGQIEFCNFSSWCRFPVYEVDFGWGKPIWVSSTNLPFKNVVILMSTKCGDGIEAWVNMAEEDMAMLEGNHEFYSLVADELSA